jgi:hypothetical protein
LLPLLERQMAQVAAELGIGDLTGHGLGFEDVLAGALSGSGSGYWAERAIAWLEAGFPTQGYRQELQLVVAGKRVPQRARQVAARILARDFPASSA